MRGIGGGSSDQDIIKLEKSLKIPSSNHQSSFTYLSARHVLKLRHFKYQREKRKRMNKQEKEQEEGNLSTKSVSNSRYHKEDM